MGGGLAIAVTVIGVLLAATTGIIGASVVLLALLGAPVMLKEGYDKSLAAGTVCAVGTLGILIPPSIMLVLMADRMAMSVGDLFLGAVFPGLLFGGLYVFYIVAYGLVYPAGAPKSRQTERVDFAAVLDLAKAIVPPALLIAAVLGSIFFGLATPTEAAGVGALGALLLALANRALNRPVMTAVMRGNHPHHGIHLRCVDRRHGVLLGAAGPRRRRTHRTRAACRCRSPRPASSCASWPPPSRWVSSWTGSNSPSSCCRWWRRWWQPSASTRCGSRCCSPCACRPASLTPPVGFAIFYFKGVAPPGVAIRDVYRGVAPFIVLQLIGLAVIFHWEALVTWLPAQAYGVD